MQGSYACLSALSAEIAKDLKHGRQIPNKISTHILKLQGYRRAG